MEQTRQISKPQLAAIATLCTRLGYNKETKAVIVEGFSGGRCTSSRDLTQEEARQLIEHLNNLLPPDTRTQKMIGKILFYCHEMGWTKKNARGKTVADGKRFDEWAVKYGYLRKKLNQYKYSELPKLVSQFEAVYKGFLKKI